jgi:hypothetical protein
MFSGQSIKGRGGADLDQQLAAEEREEYLGLAAHNFPNLVRHCHQLYEGHQYSGVVLPYAPICFHMFPYVSIAVATTATAVWADWGWG